MARIRCIMGLHVWGPWTVQLFMETPHRRWYRQCLRCGRNWQDGEWMPLAFERGSRRKSIERAKRLWRKHHER